MLGNRVVFRHFGFVKEDGVLIGVEKKCPDPASGRVENGWRGVQFRRGVSSGAAVPVVGRPHPKDSGAEPPVQRTVLHVLPLWIPTCDDLSSCGDGSLDDAMARSLDAPDADCMGKDKDN